MGNTKAGVIKARNTIYQRHGKDFYRRIGRIGGRNGHTGGFAANHELARRAGAKGGRKRWAQKVGALAGGNKC